MHKAIKYSIVHHFADDTNLLYTENSIKQLSLKMNHDLNLLCEWLRTNQLSLNVKKTELIIFRAPNHPLTNKYKFKIDGKKLTPTNKIKYLGVTLDEHLTWKCHFNNVNTKLNRAIGILSKLRYYIQNHTLRTVYYALFSSHMTYACQIWGQSNTYITNKIQSLQNRALKKISFADFNSSVNLIFKKLKMLKFEDLIHLQNCIFMHSFENNNIPEIFQSQIKQLFSAFEQVFQIYW